MIAAHHNRREAVHSPDGDRETGGNYRGRHDVTEAVGAAVAEVAHTRDYGEVVIAAGGSAGDAVPLHDAVPMLSPESIVNSRSAPWLRTATPFYKLRHAWVSSCNWASATALVLP